MRLVDYDDESTSKYVKALVYGASGTGKTSLGVTAPKPLILLSEIQAIPSIKAAAKRLGRGRPPALPMDSTARVGQVLRAFKGDRSKPFIVPEIGFTLEQARAGESGAVAFKLEEWPESLVIDSLTEVIDIIVREIRAEAPPRPGKDGLPVDSERFWNVLEDRGRQFIKAVRDVPAHVLFLALLEDKEVGPRDGIKVRQVGPAMAMRKLQAGVMAAVNVVGVTYRRRVLVRDTESKDPKATKSGMVYGVTTTGPEYMALKPFAPLRDREVTDFSSWVARINGSLDSDEQQPPPMIEDEDMTPAAEPDKAAEPETKAEPEKAAS
jgi:hypothetical protein